MREYALPYGEGKANFQLPDWLTVDEVQLVDVPGVADPYGEAESVIVQGLERIGKKRFSEIRSAAIAINDKTRPVPHQYLLPPLLKHLERLGLQPEAITFLVAVGTHTPMPDEELITILPEEILRRYPVISHNADDRGNLVYLTDTQRGTPVWINRRFMDADLRMTVGNIEPHHFMGFSGGAKSAVIGLAGRDTITINHSMLSDPRSRTAHYEDNPMRQDVEEMGALVRVDFSLNVILNPKKEIVKILAGNPQTVMLQGIPISRQICQVKVHGLYDLVLASPGGHPKDINFYQSQKGLTHAAMLTRDGGTVILVAACPEGIGSSEYERWMANIHSHAEVNTRFLKEGFQVGPHKAFMVARDASRLEVVLFSEMPPAKIKKILLHAAPSLQQAIDEVLVKLQQYAKVAIMPSAAITIPEIQT